MTWFWLILGVVIFGLFSKKKPRSWSVADDEPTDGNPWGYLDHSTETQFHLPGQTWKDEDK